MASREIRYELAHITYVTYCPIQAGGMTGLDRVAFPEPPPSTANSPQSFSSSQTRSGTETTISSPGGEGSAAADVRHSFVSGARRDCSGGECLVVQIFALGAPFGARFVGLSEIACFPLLPQLRPRLPLTQFPGRFPRTAGTSVLGLSAYTTKTGRSLVPADSGSSIAAKVVGGKRRGHRHGRQR